MPHYVTQLDDRDDGFFAVYSTIVDNLITEEMPAEEMKQWLIDNEYTSWLTQDPTFGLEGYSSDTRDSIIKYRQDAINDGRMYWSSAFGFQYVKLSDNWYTLPRECWRY